MELSEVIENRRSTRKFDINKDVTDTQIKQILNAAILAPSSGNTQCWHFVVVKDEMLKEKLSKEAGHQSFIAEAPIVIVVCADLNCSERFGERGVETYCLQDTAAAIQNMLLTITAIGLATCWVGSFDEAEASIILELKAGMRPVAILPIGYAAEESKMPTRKTIDQVSEWK